MVATVIHGIDGSTESTELLRVRVTKGERLGKRDLFGVISPYCVIRLEKLNGEQIDEITLEKKKKTRDPIWNAVITLRVTRQCCLKFLIFDENKIRKDALLGLVEFDLSTENIGRESSLPTMYPLKGGRHRNIGNLWIGMHYLPSNQSPSESNSDLQESNTMPEGWEQREDGNGRTFYVNHLQRTTHWDRPTQMNGIERERNEAEVRRRRDDYERRRQVTNSSPDVVRSQLEAIDNAMRSNFIGGTQTNDEGDEEPLPEGWDMQIAPNGRIFFIDHRTKTTTWLDPRTGVAASRPQSGKTDDEIGALPEGWEQRVHTDGRVFFIDHNNRRTQWEDPRFENESIAGPAIPYSRDYKRKVEYLHSKLPRASSNGKCDMVVHRETLFEDSYRHIMEKTPSELRNKLWIEFFGETGLDYGGVTREWFFLLSHDIFNPYYGLFEYSATDNYTLQINPHSAACNPDHLSYFYFIGKVMGMAIYHGKLLDAFFIRPFYKMMLGKKITLFDMESVDNAYYNSLIYVKDNDPEELELTFSVDDCVFGETQTIELIENGREVRVTEANKEEYIEAVVNWRFVKRVEPQMEQILRGLHEVVPSNLLRIFDANEMELLMCGLQKIDVKDWKAHTIYKGGYGPSSQVIHNFWKCILSFDNEMRARVLQFVSGTSRVPMNGFRELYAISYINYPMCHDVYESKANSTRTSISSSTHLAVKNCGQFEKQYLDTRISHVGEKLFEYHHNPTTLELSRVATHGLNLLIGSNGPQKFTIERWGSSDMLPRAHTCFNRLDLPPYQTFSELKQKLCIAIENSEIFSGVD